jgi:predicted O-methyltransferase YrrM
MALPLHSPEQITSKRGWEVIPNFEPLPFSNAYLTALKALTNDPECPGHSDVGIRNLLFSLVLSLKPESVLEIGGHIGSAALVIGEAMRINGFGKLTSLEPQEHYYRKITDYIRSANLMDYVDVIKGFSNEAEVYKKLIDHQSFELIFLDACHDYQVVLDEITQYRDLLCDNGIMVLHDTSLHGQSFDATKQGGVRKALIDATRKMRDLQPIYFEYPLWLNNCGAAILCKQRISLGKSIREKLSCIIGSR